MIQRISLNLLFAPTCSPHMNSRYELNRFTEVPYCRCRLRFARIQVFSINWVFIVALFGSMKFLIANHIMAIDAKVYIAYITIGTTSIA